MRKIEELKNVSISTSLNVEPGVVLYSGFVRLPDCGACKVMFGYNEDGYEHVSISPVNSHRMPSWDDMSRLKNIFFYPEEEAYQIMPKKSEYVNVKGNCLHLWRPANGRVLQELV